MMTYVQAASLASVALPSARPGSLVKSTSSDTTWWLISRDDKPIAVALTGTFKGHGFEASQASNWYGLEYLGVQIEIDHTSGIDSVEAEAGTLYLERSGTTMKLVYKHDTSGGFLQWAGATIAADLPPSSENRSHLFTRWRVTLGEWEEKVVLIEVCPVEAVE